MGAEQRTDDPLTAARPARHDRRSRGEPGVTALAVLLVPLFCAACGSGGISPGTSSTTESVTTSPRHVVAVPWPRLPTSDTPAEVVNRVLIPLSRGRGSRTLRTIVPTGTVYFESSCRGRGRMVIASILDEGPCDAPRPNAAWATTGELPGYEGKHIVVTVKAPSRVRWELWIGETRPVHRAHSGT
jgi:hypothetical protein